MKTNSEKLRLLLTPVSDIFKGEADCGVVYMREKHITKGVFEHKRTVLERVLGKGIKPSTALQMVSS